METTHEETRRILEEILVQEEGSLGFVSANSYCDDRRREVRVHRKLKWKKSGKSMIFARVRRRKE